MIQLSPITPDASLTPFLLWVEERCKRREVHTIPRFTIGPSATSFMLWHLTELYDISGEVRRSFEQLIEQANPGGLELREAILSLAGPGQNERPFLGKNYLDGPCRRIHVVLKGNGILEALGKAENAIGTRFEITPEDISVDQKISGISGSFTIHLVLFWATPGSPPVWKMRA